MTGLLFLVLMQFAWSFGFPQDSSVGGGAYAYSDSTGKRYSGTYGLKDGKVVHSSGDYPVPFAETAFPGYGYGYGFQGDNFYPNYFSNLENLLQEVFHSNLENQHLAYNAARKAFDLSSNQAGYFPNFATRLQQPAFPDFGAFAGRFGGFPDFHNFAMPNFENGAYASSAVGPGYRQQVAALSPEDPNQPNVKVSHFSDTSNPGGQHYSVSSSSYASSMNVDGKEVSHKGAETVVNDNGKITKYKVGN